MIKRTVIDRSSVDIALFYACTRVSLSVLGHQCRAYVSLGSVLSEEVTLLDLRGLLMSATSRMPGEIYRGLLLRSL